MSEFEDESIVVDPVTTRIEAYSMLVRTLNETSHPEIVAEGIAMLKHVRENFTTTKAPPDIVAIDGGKSSKK